MQRLLDQYVLQQIAAVFALIALTLAGVLLMTQSMRFLELIIESGASGLAFITLSLLALPRFFEVILPIALAAGTMAVYHRLAKDGEITVMQAAGMTPYAIARPGFMFSGVVMLLLFIIMSWIAPMTLAHMKQLRQVIKAQYSALLFREGVFNMAGPDVTVYVAERLSDGGLKGLMIYDARPVNPVPITVMARQGELVATEHGQQVIVYNGTRQTFNPNTQAVERLNFDRYIIELPDSAPVQRGWSEPEERTILQLLRPRPEDQETVRKAREYNTEFHRRLVSPLLAPSFFAVTILILLLAPFGRTYSGIELLWPASTIFVLQALYIGTFSLARAYSFGYLGMYVVVLGPLAISAWFIFRASRGQRQIR